MKRITLIAILFVSFLTFYSSQTAASTSHVFTAQKDVPIDKTFTIKFNQKVDIHSVDSTNIYVKDARGNVVDGIFVALQQPEQKQIIVKAPPNGYAANSSYTLYVENGIESAKGKRLMQAGKMSFTTSSRMAQKFKLRDDSLNEVAFQPGTVVLTEQQGNALIDGEEQDQQFSFHAKNGASIEHLKRGDIVVFPATTSSPNGFAKKVVSVTNDGTRITLKTSEPTYDEVIKEIDISKEVAVSTDNFQLSPEIESQITASLITEKNRKRTFKNDDGTLASVEFKDLKDQYSDIYGTEIVFENFKYDLFQTGANTPLNGSMEFIFPKVTLDSREDYIYYLDFVTGFNMDFGKTITLDSFENKSKERVELPVQIPMKYAGVVGGVIVPYLDFDTKGEIEFGFKVGYETNLNVGLYRDGEGWHGFNNSVVNPVANINSLQGSVEGRLAAGLAIQIEVLQFALGGVEGSAYAQLKLEGELSLRKVCYTTEVTAGVQAAGYVGDHKNSILDIRFLDYSIDLSNNTKCDMKSIASKPLTIEQGKSKKLAVMGTDFMAEEYDFKLPNNAISFHSHNEDIATVTRHGIVKIAKDAAKGSSTKVTITYRNAARENVKIDVIITVKPEEVVKTYTIKEWGLTFELPEDVKLYDIEWNYGYHISKGDGFMAYIERYDADFEPSFRGYWSYLGTKKGYSYYVKSGFNIFFDDENSPYYNEQAEVFSSIQKSARFE